ncbi:MAG: hypothetical protein HYU86_08150 [Chloroflexi bacterium]|nr:hypothetical protein [Chloroflexota bacterium]
MPKFIGLHSLPGFTREMLSQGGQTAAQMSVNILKIHGDTSTGRVICEVEAPNRETFVSWLNKINMPYEEVVKVEFEISMNAGGPGP